MTVDRSAAHRPLADYDLMDPKVQQCPYAFYASVRAQAPLYRMPDRGFWLVASFDLCREVMRQPDLYASGVSPMALKPGDMERPVRIISGKATNRIDA